MLHVRGGHRSKMKHLTTGYHISVQFLFKFFIYNQNVRNVSKALSRISFKSFDFVTLSLKLREGLSTVHELYLTTNVAFLSLQQRRH
jgi:hypothetical protein